MTFIYDDVGNVRPEISRGKRVRSNIPITQFLTGAPSPPPLKETNRGHKEGRREGRKRSCHRFTRACKIFWTDAASLKRNSSRSTDIFRGCIFTVHCVIAFGSYAGDGRCRCLHYRRRRHRRERDKGRTRRCRRKRVKVEIRRLWRLNFADKPFALIRPIYAAYVHGTWCHLREMRGVNAPLMLTMSTLALRGWR